MIVIGRLGRTIVVGVGLALAMQAPAGAIPTALNTSRSWKYNDSVGSCDEPPAHT